MENATVAQEEDEDIGDNEDRISKGGRISKNNNIVNNPKNAGDNTANSGDSLIARQDVAVNDATEDRQKRNHAFVLEGKPSNNTIDWKRT